MMSNMPDDEEGHENTAAASTVLTTPLLSSSSASGDAALPGSNVVVAVTASRTPPYVRYRLASRCIPPDALPPRLEQANISAEEWTNFWSKLKPLVLQVEQHEKYGTNAGCGWVVLWIWGMFEAIQYADDHEAKRDFSSDEAVRFVLLSFYIPPFLFVALRLVYQQMRQWLFADIASFCRDAGEVTMFHANRYNIECELLPSEVNGSRLHMFILPVDKPYTRFEVYNGMRGSTSTYQTSLGSGDVRPNCFESLPLDDWNSLWSAMRKLYEPQTKLLHTYLFVVGYIFITWLLILFSPNDSTGMPVALFSLVLLALACFSAMYNYYRFEGFLAAKVNLVYDYGIRFAPRGIFMEHRRLFCLHPWWGLYERHYVYMFRLTADPSVDHDDFGLQSSGAGIRERHGTSSLPAAS